jgi:hypothetical protein
MLTMVQGPVLPPAPRALLIWERNGRLQVDWCCTGFVQQKAAQEWVVTSRLVNAHLWACQVPYVRAHIFSNI